MFSIPAITEAANLDRKGFQIRYSVLVPFSPWKKVRTSFLLLTWTMFPRRSYTRNRDELMTKQTTNRERPDRMQSTVLSGSDWSCSCSTPSFNNQLIWYSLRVFRDWINFLKRAWQISYKCTNLHRQRFSSRHRQNLQEWSWWYTERLPSRVRRRCRHDDVAQQRQSYHLSYHHLHVHHLWRKVC